KSWRYRFRVNRERKEFLARRGDENQAASLRVPEWNAHSRNGRESECDIDLQTPRSAGQTDKSRIPNRHGEKRRARRCRIRGSGFERDSRGARAAIEAIPEWALSLASRGQHAQEDVA